MKIIAVVHKIVEIELEVDDKFASLKDDDFWEHFTDKAEALADELKGIIENSDDDIIKICGGYDSAGYCMFEN